MRLQVQRPELVAAEHDLRLTSLGNDVPSAIAYKCSARAFFTA
ncbi:hypothetical protein P3H15_32125 [Rhodococcus sp. T2V]|nr:hypothetical protein [Rhodococcus sp. T2V]